MDLDPKEVLVARLRATAKYGSLCDDVLQWAAQEALAEDPSSKTALKDAKRRLHQAFGAFVDAPRRKALLRLLDEAAAATGEAWRRHLWAAQALHTSTAERMATLEAVWARVLHHAGPVTRVVDLGCGMGPAALPWSGLPVSVDYLGIDLDETLCAALQRALRPGFPRAQVRAAEVRSAPVPPADLVLMWKLLPTLERQRAGAARALVDRVQAATIVATFPTRSLGGRDVGMADHYLRLAEAVLGPGTAEEVGHELLYVVHR